MEAHSDQPVASSSRETLPELPDIGEMPAGPQSPRIPSVKGKERAIHDTSTNSIDNGVQAARGADLDFSGTEDGEDMDELDCKSLPPRMGVG